MTTALQNRLDRLESQLLPSDDEAAQMIFVCFEAPGVEREATRAECGGRHFARATGETLEAFRQRIRSETLDQVDSQSRRVVLMLNEPLEKGVPAYGARA